MNPLIVAKIIEIVFYVIAIPIYTMLLSMMVYFGKVMAMRILFKNKGRDECNEYKEKSNS